MAMWPHTVAESGDMGDEEFVTLDEVAAGAGVTDRTVRKRLQAAGIVLYQSPWDGRSRLVKRTDLERLVERPQPIATGARSAA